MYLQNRIFILENDDTVNECYSNFDSVQGKGNFYLLEEKSVKNIFQSVLFVNISILCNWNGVVSRSDIEILLLAVWVDDMMMDDGKIGKVLKFSAFVKQFECIFF